MQFIAEWTQGPASTDHLKRQRKSFYPRPNIPDAKSLAEPRKRRDMIKALDGRTVANQMEKKVKLFPQKSERRQVCLLSPFLFTPCLFNVALMIPAREV